MCEDVAVPNEVTNEVTNVVEQSNEKTLKLRPLGDRILVRVIKVDEDELVNGLVRPGVAIEKPSQGVVVAVGKGTIVNGERVPVDLTVGNLITFGRYSGNEVDVLSEKLLLLSESEIMGEYYAE
jgi:chaperonin GroES